MAKRSGRRPLPDVLKAKKGTLNTSRVNNDQPEFSSDGIQVPAHFDEQRRAVWFDIVPNLIRNRVVKDVDVYMLEMLCEKWVEWRTCQDAVNDRGIVVQAPSGYPMLNPFWTSTMKLGREIQAILTEFGMTPAARSKVSVNPKDGGGRAASEGRFAGL